MRNLTPEEEIQLRRIAKKSLSVDAKLTHRLVRLRLVERSKNGWGLTPLGLRQYMKLTRPALLRGSPAYIERLLDRAIPLARAARIYRSHIQCLTSPTRMQASLEIKR